MTISSFSCRWELGGGGYYFWIYLLVREVSNFIEKATENKFLLILSLFDAMPALWYYHPLIAYGTHMWEGGLVRYLLAQPWLCSVCRTKLSKKFHFSKIIRFSWANEICVFNRKYRSPRVHLCVCYDPVADPFTWMKNSVSFFTKISKKCCIILFRIFFFFFSS